MLLRAVLGCFSCDASHRKLERDPTTAPACDTNLQLQQKLSSHTRRLTATSPPSPPVAAPRGQAQASSEGHPTTPVFGVLSLDPFGGLRPVSTVSWSEFERGMDCIITISGGPGLGCSSSHATGAGSPLTFSALLPPVVEDQTRYQNSPTFSMDDADVDVSVSRDTSSHHRDKTHKLLPAPPSPSAAGPGHQDADWAAWSDESGASVWQGACEQSACSRFSMERFSMDGTASFARLMIDQADVANLDPEDEVF